MHGHQSYMELWESPWWVTEAIEDAILQQHGKPRARPLDEEERERKQRSLDTFRARQAK